MTFALVCTIDECIIPFTKVGTLRDEIIKYDAIIYNDNRVKSF